MDRRLITLASGMFAIGTDSFVVAGILPLISQSMHASVATVGLMVSLYAISYAVLSPVIAALAAGWSRKGLLLSGIAIFVFGNVMTAMAPSLTVLLGSRLVTGLGAAMFGPTATAVGASLVPPAQRGRALAIVIAGLTSATALGSPIGTFLGSLGDWRITLWFVAALGAIAAAGIWILLPPLSVPPAVNLRQRLAPLADSRVTWTLLTTLLAYCGVFIVYTYIGVSFDRVTGGNGNLLALLLLIWGLAATAGNLAAGRMTDRLGSRRIINTAILVCALDFALLPWASASLAGAIPALIIWAVCGWGLLVPQQHRLLAIFPAMGPLLMGLNSAAIYLGVSASGVLGGLGIRFADAHHLGWIGAIFLILAFGCAEIAYQRIAARPVPATASLAP